MGERIPSQLLPLQPLDRFGRALHDLRISVIDRCNFRCPYCLPEDQFPEDFAFLKARQRLDFDEIERLARLFAQLGVSKLRLTGGEPLLRKGLVDLVRRLARIPGIDDLAMTTNGSLLPRWATELRQAGLQRVTLSLDSLDPETYRRLSGGRGEVAGVEAAITAAERAGFTPLKLNCVIMRGVNDAQVSDLVERFRGSGHILRFIEYMDVGTLNHWQQKSVVPSAELRQRIAQRWPLKPVAPRYPGEVAQRYVFRDGGGEIGFISAVSEPFCGGCTRARLSADGRLYACLFAGTGLDLRGPLRTGESDEELRQRIAGCWSERRDRYSELRAQTPPRSRKRVEMFEIGG